MPLTQDSTKRIAKQIANNMLRLYLFNEYPTQIGGTIGANTAKIKGTAKTPAFGDAQTGTGNDAYVDMTNNTTTNPLVYAFPSGTEIQYIVLTDAHETEGSRVIKGIITIPLGDRPVFNVDGAYYIRQLRIKLTETS